MITVKGKGVLVGMLADLALTASSDPVLPFLRLICLHTEGGRLHGWSTDRYRAAHAAVDCDGELDEPVQIQASDAANLLKLFRAELFVDMKPGDGGVEFRSTGPSLAVPTVALDESSVFPQLSRIAVDELPEGNAPVMFDPKFLAGYVAIGKRRKEHVRIVGAKDRKPAHISIGADYRAWQMPLLGEDNYDHSWLTPSLPERP